MNKILQTNAYIKMLSIYRPVFKDDILKSLSTLISYISNENYDLLKGIDLYNSFFYKLSSLIPLKTLKDYVEDKILYTTTSFSTLVEATIDENIEKEVLSAVSNELYYLQEISKLTNHDFIDYFSQYSDSEIYKTLIEKIPSWDFSTEHLNNNFLTDYTDWKTCLPELIKFHKKFGSGNFAKYTAFTWETNNGNGFFRPVLHPDTVKISDLIGYEKERRMVIQNTINLLNGHKANNVLLYGDRGTGKSSTVKAILNEYSDSGLRLIEVKKDQLVFFPEIIRQIRKSRLRFILFVDDLSFQDSGNDFTSLKAALEGGIENTPSNVVIYATSNRRHLIKETFSDRKGIGGLETSDEVRAQDTIQEKLSLSDRFGITVVFSSPDKNDYLEIVKGLAERNNIDIPIDDIYKEALKWELWYNSRSPRTAHQFINWLKAKHRLS